MEKWNGEERRKLTNGRRVADGCRLACGEHNVTVYRVEQMEQGFADHLQDTKEWRKEVSQTFKSYRTQLIATLTSAVLSLIGIIAILLVNLAKAPTP